MTVAQIMTRPIAQCQTLTEIKHVRPRIRNAGVISDKRYAGNVISRNRQVFTSNKAGMNSFGTCCPDFAYHTQLVLFYSETCMLKLIT